MNGRIDSGLGQIIIDTDVIATYAGSVAVECFGIVGMAAVSMKDGLVKLLGKNSLKHGISVRITEDNKIRLNFHVIVAYGVNISTIADNLVSNVKYKVEAFTGMEIEKINPEDYPELNIDITGATYEYNENYPKGQVFDQSPKANDRVKGGKTRTVTLKVSLGNETNKMPNLVNQTDSSAIAQLNAMELGLKITTKEESSETVLAGYVIRTEPAAETQLTKNQAVTLYVSLGYTKMPDLKNQTKANAEALLDAMGLNLKYTFLEEESDDVAEGNVTRTEPASKSELSKGQNVTVYISKGNGKVDVPPVEGLDVMDAIKLLRDAGLKYETKRVFNEKEEKDRVIHQSEKANTQVPKDTIVVLEVSDGPAPTDPPTQPTTPPTEPTEPSTEPSTEEAAG